MSILASAADNLVGVTFNESLFGFASVFVGLALIVPLISVTIRRLNDTCEKRSAWLGDWIGDIRPVWWLLLSLFCLLAEIFVFIFCLMDSDPGPNKYGPNPNHLTICSGRPIWIFEASSNMHEVELVQPPVASMVVKRIDVTPEFRYPFFGRWRSGIQLVLSSR